ncbi:MAG TPA: mannose-1-phosphate guanylyltransferase [Spirochaetota bacterium]|nr:mannose-1-phosphate guanylyltransferase [Spirochaetota bacterium]
MSENTMKVVPVIMAGGAGTRLWPLSREEKPKQFHDLSGDGTLLEQTIKRLLPLKPESCVIVTARCYENASYGELERIGMKGTVLSEPRPRNTAPAVLYAAIYLSKIYSDCIMIVLPADHYIRNPVEFAAVLRKVVTEAEKGNLATIGIKPLYPETGYGYIKAVPGKGDAFAIESFVEKPDLETAERYFAEGTYYWNSGIYAWKTSVIMDEFKHLLPRHYEAFAPLGALGAGVVDSSRGDAWAVKERIFGSIESISIDYGIMEKARKRVVVPGDFGWGDLGSWNSIDDILRPDGEGNRSPSGKRAIFVGARDCSVFAETKRIAVVGLSNVVVVQSGNDILVMEKNASQRVREVVDIVRGLDSGKKS